jgi:hypothetical protein
MYGDQLLLQMRGAYPGRFGILRSMRSPSSGFRPSLPARSNDLAAVPPGSAFGSAHVRSTKLDGPVTTAVPLSTRLGAPVATDRHATGMGARPFSRSSAPPDRSLRGHRGPRHRGRRDRRPCGQRSILVEELWRSGNFWSTDHRHCAASGDHLGDRSGSLCPLPRHFLYELVLLDHYRGVYRHE